MNTTKFAVPFAINNNFEIPSIPLVLIKIIQTLDADTSSARELERLILHDPALSARILRLANSAFYSFRTQVKTISHAIALLGINLVTSLAIGINVFDSFTKGAKSEGALISKLWTHSCGVGILVKEICARRNVCGKESEFAFLCGLLHDIGKAVLFQTHPGRYSAIFAISKTETDGPIESYEESSYGVNHAVIGEMLAKQWGFPTEMISVIRRHHDPSAVDVPIINAVMLADVLAKKLKIGYDGDDGLYEALADAQSKLHIAESECESLMEFASRERENIGRFFKIAP